MNTEPMQFPRRSFVAGAATLGALAVANPLAAFAVPSVEEAKREVDAAVAAVQSAEAASAEKQAEVSAAYAALENMQQSLDEASQRYTQCLMDEEAARARVEECQGRIEVKSAEMAELQQTLSNRARSIYRTGGNSFIDVLLGSSSFEEFSNNWSMLNSITNQDADYISATRAAREELQDARKELEVQEKIAQDNVTEAERIRAEAEATVAEMQAIYDSLSDEAAALLEQERAARDAEDSARTNLATAEAEEERRREEERLAAERAAAEAAAAAAAAAAQQQAAAAAAASGGAVAAADTVSTVAAAPAASASVAYEGGSDIVSRARACLGAPYVWGAVGPYGYDCSGLVSYCYLGRHERLGTTYTFMGYPQVSNPQPGDICTHSSHCGIYIGDGQMIHAATYGVGVIVGPVQAGMIIVRP
ncbi:MAG: C40 family peptidase [Eggerthellaceae bacterium]|nr:C40 family peptidase [Eggerthellaceae bacterium]